MTSTELPLATKIALAYITTIVMLSFLAPIIAPFDPYDPIQLQLKDGKLPPFWLQAESSPFILGTDPQGRDMLSAVLFGCRLSILVALLATFLAAVLGTILGLLAGYFPRWLDTPISRLAEIQLTFPSILLAFLFNGLVRAAHPAGVSVETSIGIMVLAIALADWPQFARVVRSATIVESGKEYILSAKILGLPARLILARHIFPNVVGTTNVVLVNCFVFAITTEATLSFLGQGIPLTQPSLGSLIRVGNEFMYSGLWWILTFPTIVLVGLVFGCNLLSQHLSNLFERRQL